MLATAQLNVRNAFEVNVSLFKKRMLICHLYNWFLKIRETLGRRTENSVSIRINCMI